MQDKNELIKRLRFENVKKLIMIKEKRTKIIMCPTCKGAGVATMAFTKERDKWFRQGHDSRETEVGELKSLVVSLLGTMPLALQKKWPNITGRAWKISKELGTKWLSNL